MPKQIVVIGAVALGPKAAARCKRLDPNAKVTMIDQSQYISYGACGLPYYISSEVENINALRQTTANVLRDPKFFKDLKGVDVLTETKALSIDRVNKKVKIKNLKTEEVSELPYDQLVIATGSNPIKPNIPGMELANIHPLASLDDAVAIRKACEAQKINNLTIVGGGMTGIEVAIALADMWGIECTILNPHPYFLPSQISSTISDMIVHDLNSLGIKVIFDEEVLSFNGENNAVAEVITSKQRIEADYVIIAMNTKPNSDLAMKAGIEIDESGGITVNEFLQTSDHNIYAGGDCVAIRNIITNQIDYIPMGSIAGRQGRIIGTNLAGGNPELGLEKFEGAVGTWCIKLAEGNVAGVGLSATKAKKYGYDAVSISMEQLDREHYYPEKDMMSLEITVEKSSRRILGLQGYCKNGDALKARIDAVAGMLQIGKPTLNDLSNLEVAYSPPLASAMDAINSVANVADNVLSGLHQAISPKEFVELFAERDTNNYIFLDTRPKGSGDDLAQKYPEHWFAIPLEGFEEKISDLPENKNIALICNSGTRAYECQQMLKKHGKSSKNSSGGMQAMKKRGQKF